MALPLPEKELPLEVMRVSLPLPLGTHWPLPPDAAVGGVARSVVQNCRPTGSSCRRCPTPLTVCG